MLALLSFVFVFVAMATERELLIKWSGQELKFTMGSTATVGELKRQIAEQTSVAPKRQKLLGLKAKNAKLASDEVLIEDLVRGRHLI